MMRLLGILAALAVLLVIGIVVLIRNDWKDL